jgi:hypothetical protein
MFYYTFEETLWNLEVNSVLKYSGIVGKYFLFNFIVFQSFQQQPKEGIKTLVAGRILAGRIADSITKIPATRSS